MAAKKAKKGIGKGPKTEAPKKGGASPSARQEIQKLRKELALANAYREEFISILSDELRTPLSVIKGYMDLAAEGIMGEIPPHLADMVAQSKVCADRLNRLIENLLDASRLESGEVAFRFQSVSLHTLIYGAISRFARLLKSRELRLEAKVKEGSPLVLADEARMREAVGHLLHNAIQHSPDGGRICIFAELVGRPRGGRAAEDWVRIQVADEGEGIPPGMRKAVFEAFRQGEKPLTRTRDGLGLGLAISKKIVEAHNGKIGLKNTKKKGTTVEILLPVDPLAMRAV